jgi:hypothetical protein
MIMFFGAHDPSAGSGEEYQGGFGPAEGDRNVPGTDTPITIRTETIDIEGKVPSTGGHVLVPAEPVPEPAPGGTSTSSLLLIGVVGGLAVWLFWGKKKSRVRARRSSRRRARRPARRRR